MIQTHKIPGKISIYININGLIMRRTYNLQKRSILRNLRLIELSRVEGERISHFSTKSKQHSRTRS